ncbi:hypothetical protein [Neisseria dentiae]|uniref:hypothetical protein n=1 Tax=Neisseria dentiae TaxID=194197 RepID=UPI0035A1229E
MQDYDLQKAIHNLGMMTQFLQKQSRDLAAELKSGQDAFFEKQRGEVVRYIRQDIKNEWDKASNSYLKDMEDARNMMISEVNEFRAYLQEVNAKNKQLVFRSWLAVSLSLLVLLIGGGWLSYQYTQVIRQNQVDAELLSLINRSDLVKCGDSLCGKFGKEKSGEYRLILKR